MNNLILASALWPYLFSGAGQSMDLISTFRFYTNGSGCVERTTLVRNDDQSFKGGRAIAGKVLVLGASWAMLKVAERTKSKRLIRVAQIENVAIGAVGTGAAVHNVRMCGL